MSGDQAFLSWHRSRRSRSLARRAGLPLQVFVEDLNGPGRHVVGILATAWWVVRRRPALVWFQYSFGLGLVLAAYRAIAPARRVKLVADIHTKALRRDGGPGLRHLVHPIKRWTLEACAAVVVTNTENARWAMKTFGVAPVILPDPLPEVPLQVEPMKPLDPRPMVVFVCSYATDEPLSLLGDVARRLASHAHCVITGDPSRLPDAIRTELGRAARLSGFVSEPRYWRLLREASAIVVPTTERACLPCGAYEAVAVGQRPILFEDPESRRVFGDLALYTQPDAEALSRTVISAIRSDRPIMAEEIRRFEADWSRSWEGLANRIRTRTTG